ncbi:hypothetical protein VdG1_03725 [Verticillium dahliae VDG1]|nr:hypothetical protein VdG1_03725 [Verticillium dahliae VDG1]
MSDRNDAGLSPAVVESIAGLSAGSVATLVVHPLDIVKTRMQIHRSSTAPKHTLTTMSLIRSLTQNPHPVASLYRGLTPNLIGNASSWARLQNYDADARFGRGVRGVATRLWREEGLRGFYRGLVPGVVRVMPATWVTFLVYENVKFYLPGWWHGA